MEAKALTNSKIKQIRSLHLKKFRDELGFFLVEGEKMVNELLATMSHQVEYIVAVDQFLSKNHTTVETFSCSQSELERISTLKNPNQVIAVVRKFSLNAQNTSFILALDSVQDPGNLGTILRLADWYGVQKIICSKTTADIYNPKVIQASMGAFLRIEVEYTDLKTYFSSTSLPIYGALLEGKNVYKEKLQPKGILVMGNEGNGISSELISMIQNKLTIPRFGQAESLNVSIATGILLSEFYRNQ